MVVLDFGGRVREDVVGKGELHGLKELRHELLDVVLAKLEALIRGRTCREHGWRPCGVSARPAKALRERLGWHNGRLAARQASKQEL